MQELNWNDLRVVLAVARCQTLAGAALRLGVNESTVGRRVARAEQRLGARLFERDAGRLHPTEAGQAVIAAAERVELEVQGVKATVSGSDALAAGLVRVTSVPMVVNHILLPALPPLLHRYPELRVELIAEPRDLSLTKREADIALRLARPRKGVRAVARRIGRLDYAVYEPTRPHGKTLPWITYEEAMSDLPQQRWMAQRLTRDGEAPARVTVNDAEAILQGVKAGLGRSLLPISVAGRDAGLRQAEAAEPVLSRELWLLVHPELRRLVRIRTVMDWLIETAARLSD